MTLFELYTVFDFVNVVQVDADEDMLGQGLVQGLALGWGNLGTDDANIVDVKLVFL